MVPFTMQTFAVFLALGLLGGRRGTYAVLVYLLLGMIGIPVFSGFRGGPGVLLGTTGGYILGFLGSALVYWLMTARLGTRTWVRVAAMVQSAGAEFSRADHGVVPGGICPDHRRHRVDDRSGLVCVSLHSPGPCQAGSGRDPVGPAGRPYSITSKKGPADCTAHKDVFKASLFKVTVMP